MTTASIARPEDGEDGETGVRKNEAETVRMDEARHDWRQEEKTEPLRTVFNVFAPHHELFCLPHENRRYISDVLQKLR